MGRQRIFTDEQRKEKKRQANNKPLNVEKRRYNSLKYYEYKRLTKYKSMHEGSDVGFNYKYLNIDSCNDNNQIKAL